MWRSGARRFCTEAVRLGASTTDTLIDLASRMGGLEGQMVGLRASTLTVTAGVALLATAVVFDGALVQNRLTAHIEPVKCELTVVGSKVDSVVESIKEIKESHKESHKEIKESHKEVKAELTVMGERMKELEAANLQSGRKLDDILAAVGGEERGLG